MKKIILIPDSFKGTLISSEICEIAKASILRHYPNCDVKSIPVADGGEGTVDCFLSALCGTKIKTNVKGPFFDEISSFYAIIGDVAIVEMAAAAGLSLTEGRRNPAITTTYGVGELINAAKERGVKKIIVGLGGSGTNDGGCGVAAACGVIFKDKNGNSFIPTGESLCNINSIHKPDDMLNGIEITVMCDIDNVMFGKMGAAHVFAAQKGADLKMINQLDDGLRHLSDIIKRDLGVDVSQIPGGGAAGATGAGMIAFFGAKLQQGIEAVLDMVEFDKELQDTDLVITGEGLLDEQSLRGKVIAGVVNRAKKIRKPVVAVVGGVRGDISKMYDSGLSAVFTINRLPEDFEVSKHKSRENLFDTIDNIIRFNAAVGGSI